MVVYLARDHITGTAERDAAECVDRWYRVSNLATITDHGYCMCAYRKVSGSGSTRIEGEATHRKLVETESANIVIRSAIERGKKTAKPRTLQPIRNTGPSLIVR